MDLLGCTDASNIDVIKPNNVPSQPIVNSNNQDLLDLLGGIDLITPTPTVNTGVGFILENNNRTVSLDNNQTSNILTGDILNTNIINGKFDQSLSVRDVTEVFTEKNVPTLTVFDKNGLKLVFALEKISESNMVSMQLTASNNTISTMTDFLFQAAVPKVSFFL